MQQVLVIGGDSRQIYLAERLKQMNFKVYTIGLPKWYQEVQEYNNSDFEEALKFGINRADIVVCPIPFTKNKKDITSENPDVHLPIEIFLKYLTSMHQVFAGVLPQEVIEFCRKNHVKYVDFMKQEELTCYNAIATAEGAIVEAITRHPRNLDGSKCVVLGYGRCGKTLVQKLSQMGAEVTIAQRRKATDCGEMIKDAVTQSGSIVTPEEELENKLKETIGQYDYIFNTIPHVILKEEILTNISKQAIIIDIASAPGGIDYKAAEKLGVKAYLCLGLPGKYSPQSSGEKLADLIVKMKREECIWI